MSRNEYLYSGILAIVTALGFWAYQYRTPQTNTFTIPPLVIDPKVWQRTDEGFQNSIVPAPLYRQPILDTIPAKKPSAPYEFPAFGDDRHRNQDDIDFDTYLNLPLVGDGVTYKNRDTLKDLEAADDSEPRLEEFSYFRLVVTETRGKSAQAAIGGIKFMKGLIHVTHPLAKVWDPHTGEEAPFKEMDPWSSDTRQFIVKFPGAVQIDSYKLRTAREANTVNSDPVKWRLEGSRNGTFWVVLDDRTDGKAYVPPVRNLWTMWKVGVKG